MLRTFHTHQVRKQTELTGCYWDFTPCTGEFKEQTFNVLTPSCWESYPDFSNYRGECIYKTTFYAEGTIRLEFKGISHTATVYVDGKEMTSHYNAYTIFSTLVENLSCGNHTLEIKVDNQFSENSALHIPNDYMTYGGIIRPVVMECLASAYMCNVCHYRLLQAGRPVASAVCVQASAVFVLAITSASSVVSGRVCVRDSSSLKLCH